MTLRYNICVFAVQIFEDIGMKGPCRTYVLKYIYMYIYRQKPFPRTTEHKNAQRYTKMCQKASNVSSFANVSNNRIELNPSMKVDEKRDPSFLHANSEDSDQTGRMPRLI